jgi:hypothetical protein
VSEVLQDRYELLQDRYEPLQDMYEPLQDRYELLQDRYELLQDRYELPQDRYELPQERRPIAPADSDRPEVVRFWGLPVSNKLGTFPDKLGSRATRRPVRTPRLPAARC